MRAASILVLALACHEEGWIRRPAIAPRSLCALIAAGDFQSASWAMATKLDSIGGHGNAATEAMVRAWLPTQPCIVAVAVDNCFPSGTPEIEARTTSGLVRVRLYPAGGASVVETEPCVRETLMREPVLR